MDFDLINKTEINEVLKLIDLYKNNKIIDFKIKNNLYNRIKSIIDHDEWYTDYDRKMIYENAAVLSFLSNKQKKSLSYSSIIKKYDNSADYYDDADSDEDRRWCD